MDNALTLSQFVDNSSTFFRDDTGLIFCSEDFSLESELVVKHVHSFSMFLWPGSSSKAVITCGHNARFEFRNVGTVTVSGLEFVGCFESHVISIGQFQLENSGFFGNSTVNKQWYSTEYKRKHCKFRQGHVQCVQKYCNSLIYVTDSNLVISHSTFTNNTGCYSVLVAWNTNVIVSYSEFFYNNGGLSIYDGTISGIYHSKFINNNGYNALLFAQNTTAVSIRVNL